jgi:glutathione S-transferase
MSALTLHIANKAYSSWSMRPWILMKTIGVPFAETVTPLRREDTRSAILKFSPSGKVPALSQGDLVVWDSLAICERLAELFPDKGVWPSDPAARAAARSVSAEMHSSFQGLRSQCPMNVRRTPRPLALTTDAQADVARIETIWASARQAFGRRGPFLFGDFSAADAMYAPVVSRILSYGIPISDASAVYMAAIQALPAWSEWMAGAAAEPWRVEAFDSI